MNDHQVKLALADLRGRIKLAFALITIQGMLLMIVIGFLP